MTNPLLIISDIDGTLLGDDAALIGLAGWLSHRRDECRLAYSSGRFIESIDRSLRDTPLPEPDYLIGGVGTDIRDYHDPGSVFAWPAVADGQWSAPRVRHALANVDRLESQPAEFQSPWKVSYYLTDADAGELAHIEARLAEAGLAADLVYSSRRDLDVLPRGIDKGAAARHLADHLDIPPQRVIVCGDTGNDLSMFRHGFRGIVVGNAGPELRDHAGQNAYLARAHHAAGVQEGLQHWFARA